MASPAESNPGEPSSMIRRFTVSIGKHVRLAIVPTTHATPIFESAVFLSGGIFSLRYSYPPAQARESCSHRKNHSEKLIRGLIPREIAKKGAISNAEMNRPRYLRERENKKNHPNTVRTIRVRHTSPGILLSPKQCARNQRSLLVVHAASVYVPIEDPHSFLFVRDQVGM